MTTVTQSFVVLSFVEKTISGADVLSHHWWSSYHSVVHSHAVVCLYIFAARNATTFIASSSSGSPSRAGSAWCKRTIVSIEQHKGLSSGCHYPRIQPYTWAQMCCLDWSYITVLNVFGFFSPNELGHRRPKVSSKGGNLFLCLELTTQFLFIGLRQSLKERFVNKICNNDSPGKSFFVVGYFLAFSIWIIDEVSSFERILNIQCQDYVAATLSCQPPTVRPREPLRVMHRSEILWVVDEVR